MTRMSATDVERTFSDVLERVVAGDEVEVTRSGAPVARLLPVRPATLTAKRFRALLDGLPTVDADFASDLAEVRASVGAPDAPAWPS